MNQQIPIYEMFPFLKETDRLATDYTEARVTSATINKAKEKMEISLKLPKPAPAFELDIIEELISKEYDIKTVRVTTTLTQPPEHSNTAVIARSSATKQSTTPAAATKQTTTPAIMGTTTKTPPTPMGQVTEEHGKVTIKGEVNAVRSKYNQKNKSWQLNFDLTDYTGTINVFKFFKEEKAKKIVDAIKKGMYLTVSGTLQLSNFDNELQLNPRNIFENKQEPRTDNVEEKRVELHLHTKMSAMDAVTDTKEVIKRAAEWGHPAIAITDHGVVQSFPDAAAAEKALDGQIKVIYGVEGYFRNDDPEPPTPRPSSPNPQLSTLNSQLSTKKRPKTYHIIILVKNKTGLKNLYKLITKSHLEDSAGKRPIILKSALTKHREGLIIGTACEAGELFDAIVEQKDEAELIKIAEYYDYLEIQPICNNNFMLYGENPKAQNEDDLRGFNKTVVKIGETINKPVAATGDVHFLDPKHEILRRVLLTYKEYKDANNDLPIYFKTTDEMLEEFSYLGQEKAYEVVITNPRKIAEMCEPVNPLPPAKKLFAPTLEGSAEELNTLVHTKLKNLYGENPPELIKTRFETELYDILDRDYDVIYMAAQKIVAEAIKQGSIVGSRGSVGSSFVAYLAGITEVNALPAHYRCPQCKQVEFAAETGNQLTTYGCGVDMPDKKCPICNTEYEKDGFNIPFETFLGFDGDKVPDIDLNFSGEYQNLAHKHTTELFGADYVYRVGTIGKLKDKTAYRAVMKYLETLGKRATKAEINRLSNEIEGVKHSTGQHAGGLIVIPQDMEITDFCPAQHPADDPEKGVITTHFDIKCMEDNLIKLDMLGHDNPTMLRMLEEMTGIKVNTIKFDDTDTMSLFTSPARLGLPENDPIIGKTGVIGIPEFGTPFTREMLSDVQPWDFDTLIRISGLTHGTGVWLGNAKDLIAAGKAARETIGCRDDIMLVLTSKGIEERHAFSISENVRKGKGIPKSEYAGLLQHGVPQWYIDSCNKITYLFPKAHATAYVMEAFRIAWYKMHKPLEYYSAHFYRRSEKLAFDAETMTQGKNKALSKIREIKTMLNPTKKDEDMLTTLESCYEFYMRGFEFTNIDLYDSDPEKFLIVDETKLRPPFVAINGLGKAAAHTLATQRENREFISIDEISATCPGLNKNHLDQLKKLDALRNLPPTSQMTLF